MDTDKADVEKATQQIKTAILAGNVAMPSNAAKNIDSLLGNLLRPDRVYRMKRKWRKVLRFFGFKPKYNFLYCEMSAAWGPRTYDDHPEWNNHGGFVLNWGAKDFGFGELAFKLVGGEKVIDPDGCWEELKGAHVECDSECMGKDFVEQALMAFTKNMVMKD